MCSEKQEVCYGQSGERGEEVIEGNGNTVRRTPTNRSYRTMEAIVKAWCLRQGEMDY
jgi:hypothetical protein